MGPPGPSGATPPAELAAAVATLAGRAESTRSS